MISGFLEKNWKITKWVALGAVIFEVKQDSALCCELLTARKVCLHFLSSYLTAAARSISVIGVILEVQTKQEQMQQGLSITEAKDDTAEIMNYYLKSLIPIII